MCPIRTAIRAEVAQHLPRPGGHREPPRSLFSDFSALAQPPAFAAQDLPDLPGESPAIKEWEAPHRKEVSSLSSQRRMVRTSSLRPCTDCKLMRQPPRPVHAPTRQSLLDSARQEGRP